MNTGAAIAGAAAAALSIVAPDGRMVAGIRGGYSPARAQLEAQIFASPVRSGPKLAALALLAHRNNRNGTAHPGYARLSRIMGCHPRTAIRRVALAVDAGLITKETRFTLSSRTPEPGREHERTNLYRFPLALPPPPAMPELVAGDVDETPEDYEDACAAIVFHQARERWDTLRESAEFFALPPAADTTPATSAADDDPWWPIWREAFAEEYARAYGSTADPGNVGADGRATLTAYLCELAAQETREAEQAGRRVDRYDVARELAARMCRAFMSRAGSKGFLATHRHKFGLLPGDLHKLGPDAVNGYRGSRGRPLSSSSSSSSTSSGPRSSSSTALAVLASPEPPPLSAAAARALGAAALAAIKATPAGPAANTPAPPRYRLNVAGPSTSSSSSSSSTSSESAASPATSPDPSRGPPE